MGRTAVCYANVTVAHLGARSELAEVEPATASLECRVPDFLEHHPPPAGLA